jgi:hypothetical protein
MYRHKQEMHELVRKFKCNWCEKSYKRKEHYVFHAKNHHPVEFEKSRHKGKVYLSKYSCNQCDYQTFLLAVKINLILEGPININSSPDCYICIAFSIDTHTSYPQSHIAILQYGHIAKFRSYGHISYMIIWFQIWSICVSVKKANCRRI